VGGFGITAALTAHAAVPGGPGLTALLHRDADEFAGILAVDGLEGRDALTSSQAIPARLKGLICSKSP